MSNRRKFIEQTVALGVAAVASVPWMRTAASVESRAVSAPPGRIKSAIRRDETIVRYGGVGDDFWLTWASDDRQFAAMQDGVGWFERPKGWYNSRLWAVSGGPRDARFQDVPAYPELISSNLEGRYYGFGTLALDGYIYQFLATGYGLADSPGWIGAKLIYSPDNGRTWRNQDGSTPVMWESLQKQSRSTLVFHKEPQDTFSLLSILQMGRNYEANRDGYVYVYSTNGNTEGTINQLVMFRVPKAQILERGAYEYFVGLQSRGNATWTKDIAARGVVHTFPRGWVNKPNPVESWLPSVVYNAPLGLYMMANWGVGPAADGGMFGKPSYLGFWVAADPWGPWRQIHEETAWVPGNDLAARCYAAVIAPKWIAEDGKSFWLVWTDYKDTRDKAANKRLEELLKQATALSDFTEYAQELHKVAPYYSFNAQRVDLVIA